MNYNSIQLLCFLKDKKEEKRVGPEGAGILQGCRADRDAPSGDWVQATKFKQGWDLREGPMFSDWCRLYLSSLQTDLSINRTRRQKNGGQDTSWSHTILKESLPLNLVKSVTLGAGDYTFQQEASSLRPSGAKPPLPDQRAPEKSK